MPFILTIGLLSMDLWLVLSSEIQSTFTLNSSLLYMVFSIQHAIHKVIFLKLLSTHTSILHAFVFVFFYSRMSCNFNLFSCINALLFRFYIKPQLAFMLKKTKSVVELYQRKEFRNVE